MNQPQTHLNPDIFPRPWLRCDAEQLQQLLQAALVSLEANFLHVNQLNVFPIPDGDTGTNMLHSMRNGIAAIANGRFSHIGQLAAQFAQGAREGARGNSGVILSEIFHGLADGLANLATATQQEFVSGLQTAVQYAYATVSDPVEGTLLTVIRETATFAQSVSQGDLRPFFQQLLTASQVSLAKTPDQLPILKQAGVVDSGGQGLVYLFQGMVQLLDGSMLIHYPTGTSPKAPQPAQTFVIPQNGKIENPYDVQFLLYGDALNLEEIRASIESMGDSTVVAGDEKMVKVHVHVKNPGEPLTYATNLGEISDVVVENMQFQMEAIINQANPPTPPLPDVEINKDQIGVIAVAAGEGFHTLFKSMRAAHTIAGGQTHNPSVTELVEAIEAIPSQKVIVLPNNKNIILSAQAAQKMVQKEVKVVPTHSAPQGLAAMLMLQLEGDLEKTAVAMQAAADEITTAEITTATRTVTLDGIAVQEGDFVGLLNGRLAASENDLLTVLFSLLEQINMAEQELITLYRGANILETEAKLVQANLQHKYPEHIIELQNGAQPHAAYILGIE